MNNNAMEQIETASVDELRSLQLERMKTLQHAYQNSTVYKKKFDEAGVHPDDLKSLKDLAKFPFTTKQDLRETIHLACLLCLRSRLSVYMLLQARQVSRL